MEQPERTAPQVPADETTTTTSNRKKPESGPDILYASFAQRLLALGIEAYILLFAFAWLSDLARAAGVNSELTYAATASLWFALFWVSPMSATPVQYIGRIKIVDREGRRLRFPVALLRAALVLAAFFAVMQITRVPRDAIYLWVVVPAAASVLLAGLTSRRQALHDLISGTVAVERKAFDKAHAAGNPGAALAGAAERPSALHGLRDLAVLVVPLYLLHAAAAVVFDMNLRSRTAYALEQTNALKAEIGAFHAVHDRLPASADELGVVTRTDYPEGGYQDYEGGRIIVRFSKLKRLRTGAVVVEPRIVDGELRWRCRGIETFDQRLLPSACRD